MTSKQKSRPHGPGGTAEKRGCLTNVSIPNNSSKPNGKSTPISASGCIVDGVVTGDTYLTTTWSRRNSPGEPEASTIDTNCLRKAVAARASRVVVADTESKIAYRVSAQELRAKGYISDHRYAPAWTLELEQWWAVSDPAGRQLLIFEELL